METRIRFVHDDDPNDPREFDGLGYMVCWHRRYSLGDEQPTADPSEWRENFEADEPTNVILPLYLLDHGGITMSTGSFTDPWDSGQVGWIVCTPDRAKDAGVEWDAEKIAECLKAGVACYARYLEGGAWGFIVENGEKCDHGVVHWEHSDSCLGFWGDIEESGALDYIDAALHDAAREQWERVGVEYQ